MNNLIDGIKNKSIKISVVGLGYVGMPLAVAFAEKAKVIGFDNNSNKIEQYIEGIDPTGEVGSEKILKSGIEFTSDAQKLKEAKFHVVAVPTPINQDKTPNLKLIESASELIGKILTKGSIVVYESTVYPGVTEDVCIPILEKISGLKCGEDFHVGYSPERINPGDKVHTLEKIVKIVSAVNEKSLEEIAKVYELIIDAGVYKASSIKVAEAAKVVENSQRDINIAFMNELAMVFDKMDIDTSEVVAAMNTKWNALKFTPGLVGGHCISVDPYYFIYEAERLGYHSQIVLAGRKINDNMGKFVAESTIKELVKSNKVVKQAKVGVLGITFKENCPDIRNSKVIDIISELQSYDINPIIHDPWASKEEALIEYNLNTVDLNEFTELDAIIVAVAHDEFKKFNSTDLERFLKSNEDENVFIDVKSIYKQTDFSKKIRYWSL